MVYNLLAALRGLFFFIQGLPVDGTASSSNLSLDTDMVVSAEYKCAGGNATLPDDVAVPAVGQFFDHLKAIADYVITNEDAFTMNNQPIGNGLVCNGTCAITTVDSNTVVTFGGEGEVLVIMNGDNNRAVFDTLVFTLQGLS